MRVVYSRLSTTRMDNDIESRLACIPSNDDIPEHNFNTPAHILSEISFSVQISHVRVLHELRGRRGGISMELLGLGIPLTSSSYCDSE